MKNFLVRLWEDEEGAEVVEYTLVLMILVSMIVTVYFGELGSQILNSIVRVGAGLEKLLP